MIDPYLLHQQCKVNILERVFPYHLQKCVKIRILFGMRKYCIIYRCTRRREMYAVSRDVLTSYHLQKYEETGDEHRLESKKC